MARKKSPNLTDAELRLMNIVWTLGSATVSDVVEKIIGDPPLHYSTVLTTLRILENKGYLKHKKEGRAFVYRAAIKREQEREKAVSHLLRRFFDGSAEMLMLNLVERENISTAELTRLRKRIAEEEQ
jgi:BlaI family transcriptional regulator, penicillinase repressor